MPTTHPSTNISIPRQVNEPRAITLEKLTESPYPTQPTLQITSLNHILTRMSLKRQLEKEEEGGGERKKKKLNFTNQEPSTTSGVQKENKMRDRPRRKENVT